MGVCVCGGVFERTAKCEVGGQERPKEETTTQKRGTNRQWKEDRAPIRMTPRDLSICIFLRGNYFNVLYLIVFIRFIVTHFILLH